MNWGGMREQAGGVGWGGMVEGWRKGPWTAEEDRLLIEHVKLHGEGRWNSVATIAGLRRNGKSCRLRWVNYLRPDLKRGQITPQEESIILQLHARWGNRWSTIARSLPGRTDNEIKNYWRTHFKKKGKSSLDHLGKLKSRLLRKQKFHEEQQLQQQQQQMQMQLQLQQQLQKNESDMKRITSLLDDIENKPTSLPESTQFERVEEHDMFYSTFNGGNQMSMSEASNEDFLWDGLWNLDGAHINYTAAVKVDQQSYTMSCS